jgi:hypothetical protein
MKALVLADALALTSGSAMADGASYDHGRLADSSQSWSSQGFYGNVTGDVTLQGPGDDSTCTVIVTKTGPKSVDVASPNGCTIWFKDE